MFLANSLKEKLKNSYLETDPGDLGGARFTYKPKPKDSRILLTFHQPQTSDPNLVPVNYYSTQKLESLDKKEWENTFTLGKLHKEWETKVNLDFDDNFKKFPDDVILPKVAKSKSFVKDLVDPDILELKPKKWKISTKFDEKMKPELHKQILNINNGLTENKAVKLIPSSPPEGVDSRNHMIIDNKIWNVSNEIVKSELNLKNKLDLIKAKENSKKYWKENRNLRFNEKPFPISENRKKIEVIRYFKKYRSPIQKTEDYYKTMEKVKEDSFIERENAEKMIKYKNPGVEKYPEKINSLVMKELYNTYKNKYNELIGNFSKEELKKQQQEKNKFKWTDIDLTNKIIAINNLQNSGLYSTISASKNILNTHDETFNKKKPLSFSQDKYNINYLTISDNSKVNDRYLYPLVSKGTEINLEEQTIQEKIEEEYKKKQKRELMLNAAGIRRFSTKEKYISKYPKTKTEINLDEDNNINVNENFNTISYLNEISTKSNCGPHFLEAYNNVAEKEFKKNESIEKKNKKKFYFVYSHPGSYREFTFMENVLNPNGDENNEKVEKKKVTTSFWSCCMNTDKNSRGCQKYCCRNFRWIYAP